MADTRTLLLRLDAETEAARAKLGALGTTTGTVAQRYEALVREARQLDIQQDILNNTTGATSREYVELSARLRRSADAFREVAAEARASGNAVDTAGDKAARAGRQSGIGGKASLLAGAAGGLAAGIGSAGLNVFQDAARDAVEFASSLGAVSKQLGVSTDFLQDFRFGATQTGATIAQADSGLAKFVVTTGKAANGNKAAAAAFKGLGVDIADANGKLKPTEQLYGEVADALLKLPDPARQASEAQKLFGDSATKLLPLLRSGSEGLDTFGAAAEALGLKLSAVDVQKISDLADKGAAVKQVLTVQMAAAIGANADAIVALGNSAAAQIGNLGRLLQSFQGYQQLVSREGLSSLVTSSYERQIDFASAEGRAKRLTAEAKAAQDALAAAEKARDTGGVIGELFGGGSQPNIAQLRSRARTAAGKATAARLELSAKRFGDALGNDAPAPAAGGDVIDPPGRPSSTRVARSGSAGQTEAQRKAEARAKVFADFKAEGETLKLQAPTDLSEALSKATKEARDNAEATQKAYAELQVPLEPVGELADETERAANAADDLRADLAIGLAEAIFDGRSIGDVLVDSFKRAGAAALANGLFKLLGGGGSGASGLGGFLKGVLGFADGGDPPVGRVSLVGERGPELFVPKVAGTIVPNGKFGFGRGGGSTTTVHLTQALHFDVGLESVDQRIRGAAPALLQAAKLGTFEALRNSGIGRV